MDIKVYENPSQDIKTTANEFGLTHFYNCDVDLETEMKKIKEKYFSVPKAILLAYEEDRVVGRVYLHKREIEFGKNPIILGGIGALCTHNNYLRQGIATSVLQESMRVLKEWGCDVAYLCANIDKHGDLYRKVGFVPLNKKYTFYGKSGELYKDDSGMIAKVNSEKLFNKILNSRKKLHLGKGNW